jgi:hypothetical protein
MHRLPADRDLPYNQQERYEDDRPQPGRRLQRVFALHRVVSETNKTNRKHDFAQ